MQKQITDFGRALCALRRAADALTAEDFRGIAQLCRSLPAMGDRENDVKDVLHRIAIGRARPLNEAIAELIACERRYRFYAEDIGTSLDADVDEGHPGA